ncbi:MAG: hypothetical protein WBH85_02570 [Thermoanaerobaculia bacterium]
MEQRNPRSPGDVAIPLGEGTELDGLIAEPETSVGRRLQAWLASVLPFEAQL